MEFDEAIIKSIRSYYEDNAFAETGGIKEVKYNKRYFDDFEAETMGQKEVGKAPKESKIDKKEQNTLANMMATTEKPTNSEKVARNAEE